MNLYLHFSCLYDAGYKSTLNKLSYVHEVEAVNANVTKEISKNFKQICYSNHDVNATLEQLVKYMNCVGVTTDSVLADTEFENLGKQLTKQFAETAQRLNECVTVASGWEANV